MKEMRSIQRILVVKPKGKRPLENQSYGKGKGKDIPVTGYGSP
jgi:hypothetical protein